MKNSSKLFLFVSFLVFSVFFPAFALAQTSISCLEPFRGKILGDLFRYITCSLGTFVVPLVVVLALVVFVWGVVQYVINGDDEAKKSKGRDFMIWGIIGLTVMVSVWGLVKIMGNTFGIEFAIPQLKSN